MNQTRTETETAALVAQANGIRAAKAQADGAKTLDLAKELSRRNRIDAARALAKFICTDESQSPNAKTSLRARQLWGMWTSQNPDGPDDSKHDEGLAILEGVPGDGALSVTTDAETLGIAGGICKRKWNVTGMRESLDDARRFYERGRQQGIVDDNGYTAINLAFIFDALASLDDRPTPTSQAMELRQEIIDQLVPVEDDPAYDGGPQRSSLDWFHVTIAQAHFGREEYDQFISRLARIDWSGVAPWEVETTARQFALLAQLMAPDARKADARAAAAPWQALDKAFGSVTKNGAASLFAGKLGLALSGGGFRASLFHIGVLAGLAELDVLRHVEVLSCVSGGSILGASYYLEVRNLLQTKPDGEITRDDYIQIVERVAKDFLAGVKKNIRTRVASNLIASLKMMAVPGYTRTSRLGELYEKHLYGRIDDDGERRLRKLNVYPKNDEKCHPKYDNWRRRNKIPILILNATSVNTGHNWQFTTSWMGEPPTRIASKVDGNYRLRRMYLESQAPARHRDISIGQAAAASSCVPGLFTPFELPDLYPDVTVRLVDGGVHDNQGVFGVLDQNCTAVIASDASGQMSAENVPPDSAIPVLLRTTSMTMAALRTAEFRALQTRLDSGRLKGLFLMHLKKDLKVLERDWIDCNDPKQKSDTGDGEPTSYGINRGYQGLLANVRTDLDSFHDAEAFALMTSGCKMVRRGFVESIDSFETMDGEHAWGFLDVQSDLAKPAAGELKTLLLTAKQLAFKVWRLDRFLKAVALVLGAAAACGLAWIAIQWRSEDLISPRGLAAAASMATLTALASAIGLGVLVRLYKSRKTINQMLIGAALATGGWLVAWIHLLVFDPLYLAKGRRRKP